jgi:hypothetical protein
MAQFRGFSGLRTYPVPLIRDLRELQRYLDDLSEQLARLDPDDSGGQPVIPPGGDGPTNTARHAWTHATKVNANTGTDSLDAYHMKWRKKQIIEPDLAADTDVPLQIKAKGSTQTADMLNVFDTVSDEQFTITGTGLAAFSGANETARVNIKGVAPTAIAPDEIGVAPFIWFRADDITGVNDATNTTSVPEKVTTNAFTAFTDGPSGGSLPIEYRSGAGSEGMNGHASVTQPSSDTDLCLNGTDDADDESYNSSVNLGSGDFTCMLVYGFKAAGADDTSTHWMIGAGRGNGTARSGLSAPITHSASQPWVQTDDGGGGNVTSIGSYDDQTDGIRIGIYRRTGSTVKYYGTKTTGDTQVSFGVLT